MISSNERSLKAIVLAARSGEMRQRDGTPQLMLLETLGEKKIIDYVIETASHFVSTNDLYVVAGPHLEQLQAHLGSAFHYVRQEDLLGTGHATLQVANLLSDYQGDLLILYGDTPLFRIASIMGLLNRHHLKQADLTLFTTVVSGSFPYGRIIRNPAGHIVDIVEEAAASTEVREIRELNLGAYVTRAELMFSVLRQLGQEATSQEVPLTGSIHYFIRSGKRITSYQSHDPDEILGINTPADLARAEYILQKRLFRPFRSEEKNEIHFGTGGWRAVIGEGFTFDNVRRLCQALANQVTREGSEAKGVLIGYDRRFLSNRAGEAAAEVFAGNNIPVMVLSEDAPTPLITYATAIHGAALGLAFTASHNPPEWNGLKVFRQDGSLLLTEETDQIETEANSLTTADVIKIQLDLALEAGIVQRVDFTNDYVDAVEAQINMNAIREAGLRLIIDPMHGVGQATLDIILTEARCRVTAIHDRHDPLFGGRSPAPDLKALGMLIAAIKDGSYDLGLATDGDADRVALVDERGQYIHINDVLLLLYYYLHKTRGLRGGIVRNLATTHLLDRLAAHFGETCYETPVGFNHIVAAMQQHDALLGGESSGGLTIRGHILGKDGIFASTLIVEMLACTGQRISELLAQVYAITGRLYAAEENAPATSDMKVVIPRRLEENPMDKLGPYPIRHVSHLDGSKFLLENDNWLLLRFSGTEPVLRIFAEADTRDKALELITLAKNIVNLKPA